MLSKPCNFYVHSFVRKMLSSQQHRVIEDANLKSAAVIPSASYEFFLIYSNHFFHFFPQSSRKIKVIFM